MSMMPAVPPSARNSQISLARLHLGHDPGSPEGIEALWQECRNRDECPVATSRRNDSAHLSDVLEEFAFSFESERITLGRINDLAGRRSIGALLLILALPMALPVPAPGISVIFGIPLILVSLQLMIGRHAAWLPHRIAEYSIPRVELVTFIDKALPRLRALERAIKPRLSWMASEWATFPVGAVCLILALVIALSIPLGHMVPGTAISILALGLMERDGLAIAIGIFAALLGLAIVTFASMGLINLLRAWFAI